MRHFLLGLGPSCGGSSPPPRGHCLVSSLCSSGAVLWDSSAPGEQDVFAHAEPVKIPEHSGTKNAGPCSENPTAERQGAFQNAICCNIYLMSKFLTSLFAFCLNMVFRCFQMLPRAPCYNNHIRLEKSSACLHSIRPQF